MSTDTTLTPIDTRSETFLPHVAGMVRNLLPLETRSDAFWSLVEVCHGLARQAGAWTDPENGDEEVPDIEHVLMDCLCDVAEANLNPHLIGREVRNTALANLLIRIFDAVGGLAVHAEMVDEVLVQIGESEIQELRDKKTECVPFTQLLYHGCGLLTAYPEMPLETIVAMASIYFVALAEHSDIDLAGTIATKLRRNQE